MTRPLGAPAGAAGLTPAGPGLVVLGHGSRSTQGIRQFWQLVGAVGRLVPGVALSAGFIELARPHVDEAVDALLDRHHPDAGAVAVPLVLLGAGHLKLDGPAVVARARARHPRARLTYARELGIHPLVLAVAEDRIREALAALSSPGSEVDRAPGVPGQDGGGPGQGGGGPGTGGGGPGTEPEETAVVLVGRGSTDPDANADLYKVARLMSDSRGLGPVEPAFVSLAGPSVPVALERCRRLGARRLAVVPYFLFTGILVERIRAQARDWAAGHPGHEVATGAELGPDPRLADLVVQRYREATGSAVERNCDCCIYRHALPGYESRGRQSTGRDDPAESSVAPGALARARAEVPRDPPGVLARP